MAVMVSVPEVAQPLSTPLVPDAPIPPGMPDAEYIIELFRKLGRTPIAFRRTDGENGRCALGILDEALGDGRGHGCDTQLVALFPGGRGFFILTGLAQGFNGVPYEQAWCEAHGGSCTCTGCTARRTDDDPSRWIFDMGYAIGADVNAALLPKGRANA